jgi:hypothetical protein
LASTPSFTRIGSFHDDDDDDDDVDDDNFDVDILSFVVAMISIEPLHCAPHPM